VGRPLAAKHRWPPHLGVTTEPPDVTGPARQRRTRSDGASTGRRQASARLGSGQPVESTFTIDDDATGGGGRAIHSEFVGEHVMAPSTVLLPGARRRREGHYTAGCGRSARRSATSSTGCGRARRRASAIAPGSGWSSISPQHRRGRGWRASGPACRAEPRAHLEPSISPDCRGQPAARAQVTDAMTISLQFEQPGQHVSWTTDQLGDARPEDVVEGRHAGPRARDASTRRERETSRGHRIAVNATATASARRTRPWTGRDAAVRGA